MKLKLCKASRCFLSKSSCAQAWMLNLCHVPEQGKQKTKHDVPWQLCFTVHCTSQFCDSNAGASDLHNLRQGHAMTRPYQSLLMVKNWGKLLVALLRSHQPEWISDLKAITAAHVIQSPSLHPGSGKFFLKMAKIVKLNTVCAWD